MHASLAAAAALLVIGVVVPGPAGASATARTKPAALPRAGDWEGTAAGGTTASFEVAQVSAPSHVKQSRGTRPATHRVVENLAVDAPISCANASQPAIPFDVEVIDGPLRVSDNGSFSTVTSGQGVSTKLSGRFSAAGFTLSYRHQSQTPNQFAGGTEVCDTGTVHITAAPGRRKQVKDGIWHGETQTHEPVAFYVAAGGRALEAPARPPTDGSPQSAFAFGTFTQTCFQNGCSTSSNDICAYYSATSLFVAPGGSFNDSQWLEGDDPIVTGVFTSAKQANGQFANGPEGCAQTDWSAEAG
ncbi:MAG TPA: hypothetical protein VG294_14540 [Solirubrobacteraceae bacterium]|nr:hypothetical protein [Solirubrobacteraceae bacterium]